MFKMGNMYLVRSPLHLPESVLSTWLTSHPLRLLLAGRLPERNRRPPRGLLWGSLYLLVLREAGDDPPKKEMRYGFDPLRELPQNRLIPKPYLSHQQGNYLWNPSSEGPKGCDGLGSPPRPRSLKEGTFDRARREASTSFQTIGSLGFIVYPQ